MNYKPLIKVNNNICVKDNNKSYTYKDCYIFAKKLNYILQKYKNKNLRIGLYFYKSADYILSLFSIFISNYTFIPLNKELPLERLKYIIEDSNIDIIITSKNNKNDILLLHKKIIFIEDIIDSNNILELDLNIEINKEKYLIYTSGSSGKPKGCIISNKGILNVIQQQIKIFDIKERSNIFLFLSINFDASLSDIFINFLTNSTLYINEEIKYNPQEFENYIINNNINYIDIPASYLYLLNPNKIKQTVKTLIIGGEVFNENIIKKYLKNKIKIINVYGPTESTICTSYNVLNLNNCNPYNIGKPLKNVEYKLIDNELYISSIQNFIGYTNHTNPFVFINNKKYYKTGDIVVLDKNNNYIFQGRKDKQLKINGNLVNLMEIEKLLLKKYKKIEVKYINKKLIVYIYDNINIDKLKIYNYLNKYLPKYMLPQNIILNNNLYEDKTIKNINNNIIKEIFNDIDNLNIPLKNYYDSLKLMEISILLEKYNIKINYEQLSNSSINDLFNKTFFRNIKNKDYSIYNLNKKVKTLPIIKPKYNQKKKKGYTLILGASGFLGSHLVNQLSKQKKVYCLVRNKEKLLNSFKYYKLNPNFNNIKIIEGNILKKNFGLSKEKYINLSYKINKIYNLIGEVNNLKSLKELYKINVLSILNILKFKYKGIKKELFHASTLSVEVSKNNNYKIVDIKIKNGIYNTGYAASKYITDKYLQNLNDKTIYILRYGLLLNNIMPKNSFYTTFIEELNKIQYLPILNKNLSMDNTNINYAVKQTLNCKKNIKNISSNKKIYYMNLVKNKNLINIKEWLLKYNNNILKHLLGLGKKEYCLFETTNIKKFKL